MIAEASATQLYAISQGWPRGVSFRCALFGNDSGVTHLAGLLGVPTVALFGPTDPAIGAADCGSLRCNRRRDGWRSSRQDRHHSDSADNRDIVNRHGRNTRKYQASSLPRPTLLQWRSERQRHLALSGWGGEERAWIMSPLTISFTAFSIGGRRIRSFARR